MPAVLVVEDEADLADLLVFNLRQAGFAATAAGTAEQALAEVEKARPELVLLDLMLPDLPGTEVCRRLKLDPRTRQTPVVMLTARADEVDRVVGFELGADDFVTKPFNMRELLLRVRAVLRRPSSAPPEARPLQSVGPIRVDPAAHRAWVGQREMKLTALEFRLLSTFIDRAGRLQTRDGLLQQVWGFTSEPQARTVDSYVKRIRDEMGEARDMLETVRGVGYRLREPDE